MESFYAKINLDMANATLPQNYEGIVYQVIRPTGLLDPVIEIRPTLPENFDKLLNELKRCGFEDMPTFKADGWQNPQIPNLINEIEANIKKGERVLVTTLTKRMAEELSDYLSEKNIKSKYLHSDIDTIERVEILRDLRKGLYDVVVGINLLREGLDLPEVSLVTILDADKEGFLRSQTSLIQTIGRAARHVNGRVIMYADKITDSMQAAIIETRKRRAIQEKYNTDNGITPQSIIKEIKNQLEKFETHAGKDDEEKVKDFYKKAEGYKAMTKKEQKKFVKDLKFQMMVMADMMEFEEAAKIRDLVKELE